MLYSDEDKIPSTPGYPDKMVDVSDIPLQHGLSHPTWKQPPLDGSLCISEIQDWCSETNAEHELFRYVTGEGKVRSIRWGEGGMAFHRAARITLKYIHEEEQNKGARVLGILANADTYTYFALMAGIMRAGHTAFPISTRNSDIAVGHLVRTSNVKYLFVSKDHAMQTLAHAACKRLSNEGYEVRIVPMPTFAELYEGDGELFEPLPSMKRPSGSQTGMILHSSGSTAFPKPIHLTQRIMLQWARLPYFGEADMCGEILSSHSLPMFHAMGAILVMWTASTGLIMSSFAPVDPPVVPTPERVFEEAVATDSTLIFCVPAFIEFWSRDAARVERLKQFKSVIFAGAPMTKSVGDVLIEQGVALVPFYGGTEFGCVTTFLAKGPERDGWEWFRLSRHVKPAFIAQEGRDDVFELVCVDCDSHTPAVLNFVVDGDQAYATSDLLVRHPSNPDLWRVFGRADDQIMHSTGEKTNPGPLEAIICRDPRISHAVMFGRGKFHAGVIVQPKPGHEIDPHNGEDLAIFRNEIWPTIEKANDFAPTHSRIFKEMIIAANQNKPFPLTAKGTPRRHVVIQDYEQEIEDAYAAVRDSSQTGLEPPASWTLKDSESFVKNVVDSVLKQKVDYEDDFFQNGCDSLEATWIRNTVLHALRTSKIRTQDIPYNFVYEHPTVRSLARFLAETAGTVSVSGASIVEAMESMTRTYSQNFPEHGPVTPDPGDEHILLTGSTGGFGSYILAELLALPSVSRVYAVNRKNQKSDKSLDERQRAVLEERGLNTDILDSKKLVLLEGDTASVNLGLPRDTIVEIRSSVTCIIHNAWRVDFNVSLQSMEPTVRGTRNLIDLALSSPHASPPRFLFISSLSVYRNWTEGMAPEKAIVNPQTAVGSGYSESKWVAEKVLEICASATSLEPTIIRVGQLSGGPNGSWNTAEWVPALVKSSQTMGCLPDVTGSVSWLPSHLAAQALVEMRKSSAPYLHLAHPKAVPWSRIFQAFAEKLGIQLTPYRNWLANLESHAKADSQVELEIPALRILGFFRAGDKEQSTGEGEAMGFPTLATDEAVKETPVLLRLEGLGKNDVDKWVQYWRQVQFLS
ncbi:acetyl-CoA synthetase-like protein [Heliocybe sulcata]|uniref:Acetyl-CoA synthetase-like protein n=1 Tax=Heliocybe sulcata TaxID=5364 RepID=A0A5C3MZ65_9AGAM|nr:acetyl-CoA synthetase-like protein [Heliocybe sulcata]